jgi:hypothetical protein
MAIRFRSRKAADCSTHKPATQFVAKEMPGTSSLPPTAHGPEKASPQSHPADRADRRSGRAEDQPFLAAARTFGWFSGPQPVQATSRALSARSRSKVACRFIHTFGEVPSASARSRAASAVIPRFPFDQLIETRTRPADPLRECRLGDAHRTQELLQQHLAGMEWVLRLSGHLPRSSVSGSRSPEASEAQSDMLPLDGMYTAAIYVFCG